ncbi:MAG TPA: ribokinase [Solirubrobacteraceae bacterium]|nr:ribokinase [Solirubrobacteraceae bacterium]
MTSHMHEAEHPEAALLTGTVYVVGSINMDVVAVTDRHPRAGETVMGTSVRFLPGGKGANQAVASRRAGAPTQMVGRVGDDAFGQELIDFLENESVGLAHTATTESPTGVALVSVATPENTIVVVPGANFALDPQHVNRLPLTPRDVVVAQFETRREAVAASFARAKEAGARTILNPAPAAAIEQELAASTDILVVNESEVSLLVSEPDVVALSPEQAVDSAKKARNGTDQTVVVTLGSNGLVALVADDVLRLAGHRVRAVDTTGAGDCFVGNLAAHLARGHSIDESLRAANRAAAACVQTMGAAVSMPRGVLGDTALAA